MTELNVQLLAEKNSELATYISNLHFQHHPKLIERYGEEGKKRCKEDASTHLNFLVEALTLKLPEIYANYIIWAAAMLKSRNIPETDLENNLGFVQQAIHDLLGKTYADATLPYITAAKEKLTVRNEFNHTFFTDDNPLKNQVIDYLDYLLQGKRREATLLINELIEQGVSIKDIYLNIFQASQYEIGRLWQLNKITVAHEHYCTAATQQIMSGLYTHIFSTTRKGKILVACSISGELHELGIRMVTDFFEMDGWDTYYLGANMPDDQLQQSLLEYKANVLALSVTLPIHVNKASILINKIRNNKDLTNVKILVGGYPFLSNPNLWKKVAADGFALNADQAIAKANELVNL